MTDRFKTGWFLLLVGAAPQLILLLWNLQAGGMFEAVWKWTRILLWLESLLLAGTTGYSLLNIARNRLTGIPGLSVLFAAGAIYLGAVVTLASATIYFQALGIVPLAMYWGFRTVYSRARESTWAYGLAAAAAAIIFCWTCAGLFSHSYPGQMAVIFFVLPTYIAIAVLSCAALIRQCIHIHAEAFPVRPTLTGLRLLAGIGFPLLGLVVNSAIPFPFDFQYASIYILAIATGILVSLPSPRHAWSRRIVAMLQALAFPFTLYFFTVFLPTLPMMPLGAIVIGGGFLLLAPSLLFLLHLHRLIEAWRQEDSGANRCRLAIALVVMACVAPLAFVGEAVRDRIVLRNALENLRYSDQAVPLPVDPDSLAMSLGEMASFKAGEYLPFISDTYQQIVFEGKLLAHSQVELLSKIYNGKSAPTFRAPRRTSPWLPRPRNFDEPTVGTSSGVRPSHDARLAEIHATQSREGVSTRTLATLDITNSSPATTEYIGRIHLPAGAYVTGLWLYIGEERRPGRIFESQSVFWVYQAVTDVRPAPRDPALLRYVGSDELELNVYPVVANQSRRVELEFLCLSDSAAEIRIEDQALPGILPVASDQSWLVQRSPRSALVVLSPSAAATLPSLQREPVLHFIVDYSEHSASDQPEMIVNKVQHAAERWPKAKLFTLTLANFESAKLISEPAPIDQAEQLILSAMKRNPLPRQGGFYPQPVIQAKLVAHAMGEDSVHFPAILLLADSASASFVAPGNLAPFAALSPDLEGYEVISSGLGRVDRFSWSGRPLASLQASEIHLLRAGKHFAGAPVKNQESAGFTFLEPDQNAPIEVVHPDGSCAQLSSLQILPDSDPISRAASVVLWAWDRALFPSRNQRTLRKMVAAARALGVLTPSASYAVFETERQWQMVEEMEKRNLDEDEILPSAVTPEPSSLLLLAAGALGLAFKRHRTSKRHELSDESHQ